MASFVWADTAKDTLFLEFLDISMDVAYVNSNDIGHIMSCYLGIPFD